MKRLRKLFLLCIFLGLLVCLVIQGNQAVEVNEHIIESESIPENFNGFRIAQISDLHNTEFGKDNRHLLELLRQAEPDIIVITGDLVDSRRTNIPVALDFAKQAVVIAPTYYVPGNHESRISQFSQLQSDLELAGVTVLKNEEIKLQLGQQSISLLGVNDPDFYKEYFFKDDAAIMAGMLKTVVPEDSYCILLSHRPELFEQYVHSGVDLVFSGHAHGGQFRVPFLGGVLVPNQGFFPEYDAGYFGEGKTVMLVSRGLGNSIIPIRINNPPEILVAQLQKK